MDPASSPLDAPEPAPIRRLRQLVSVLMAVMIVGMVCVVGLMAWRLMAPPPTPTLPARLVLPEGHILENAALSASWITLIARDSDGRLWVHVADPSGNIRASTQIAAE